MLIAALLHGNYPLAIATAPLVGALAGFLRYNFEPASIYLGDGGSLTIGFLLGCFGVVWSYKSAVAVGMTAPLILLALPWLDVALAVARRFLMMQPIFGADRGHIHHRLLARGLRPRHVALLAYLACGVAGVFSLVHAGMDSRFGWLVMAAFVGLIWLAVDRLGYAEFRVATRALMGGRLRRFVRQEILADRLAADLRGARSLDEYWDRLRDFGRQAGFGSLWLRMGDRDFTHEYAKAAVGYSWETRIPLAGSNYVAFRGDSRDLDMAQVLIPLALALRSAMPEGGVVPPHRASGSDRCAETGSRSPVETR
jgi:UDP-GlcNAc:undecaprenyl-phosphate GlcNAc-1-phosphate transferase